MSTTNSPVMLQVNKLNKRFGNVHAVKDLTFHVNKGEVFGFLGPNGAGKTTTMRIVTCFIPATSGSIAVAGLNPTEHSLQIRKKIGYLPEMNPLFHDMKVDEYLSFVGKLRGLKNEQLKRAKEEMFHQCGLTKMVGRQIGKLSKGFRQRVGLAQAMIHNPDLLILDEPMSGLDPNQIIEIRELIKQIGTQKTVIFCSHILSEVAATCQRILIINDGAVVATGTPDSLTAQSKHGDHFTLRIKAPKEAIQANFGALPHVSSVKIITVNDPWVQVHVSADGHADMGETLFKSVVNNGWSLSELKHEGASLEDVFTQLTRG